MQTQQKSRFSDGERQVIKAVFAENEELLKVIRKVMLQMPLNAVESSLAQINFSNKPETMAVVRKIFLPELDGDAPIFQVVDMWVDLTNDIKDKYPDQAMSHLEARDNFIKYIRQQLDCLEGKDTPVKIKFDVMTVIDGKSDDEAYSDILTRNKILVHTEQNIQQLLFLAGMKNESVEDTQKRLEKNSNK